MQILKPHPQASASPSNVSQSRPILEVHLPTGEEMDQMGMPLWYCNYFLILESLPSSQPLMFFCRSLLITPHWLLLVRPLALSVLCFDVSLFLGVLSGWFVRRSWNC